jgi:tRNA pseudouridine55 synthase
MDNWGILLIDKPRGRSSFSLIPGLRKVTGVKTIGHAGTLDPFATGVMVMLVGKQFTQMSQKFLSDEKEYEATLLLGSATDTFDCDGKIVERAEKVPTPEEIETCLKKFQGTLLQTPPMFSAKKIQGKKLYELARKGVTVERKQVPVQVKTTLLSYEYPHLKLHFVCSKGTYVRSLADEIGKELGCLAHLSALTRLRSGAFHLKECFPWENIFSPNFDLKSVLRKW